MSQNVGKDTTENQDAASVDTATASQPGRVFTMLENNPEVMNPLAVSLGLPESIRFHDIYSFDASELQYIPRPVYALLVTIPMTPSWRLSRDAEDSITTSPSNLSSTTTSSPVFWLPQTITHGCGLLGLIHSIANTVSTQLHPTSLLSDFLTRATPLSPGSRAQLLADSEPLYRASEAVATLGDSRVLGAQEEGDHFVALVKGRDGNLWELEGSRKGPLLRGKLEEDEDALSERALDLGLRRLLRMQEGEREGFRVSCIALAPSE